VRTADQLPRRQLGGARSDEPGQETRGSTLRFVVLAGLGQARILVDPPEAELIDSYNALVEA